MDATSKTVDDVIAVLQIPARAVNDALASLPRAKGLYA
jgi:hypothetical protein